LKFPGLKEEHEENALNHHVLLKHMKFFCSHGNTELQ